MEIQIPVSYTHLDVYKRQMADRVIKIKNGKVAEIVENKNPVSVDTIEW